MAKQEEHRQVNVCLGDRRRACGMTVCLFKHVRYLIGHDSLLGGVSSSPLLGTAGETFDNMKSLDPRMKAY